MDRGPEDSSASSASSPLEELVAAFPAIVIDHICADYLELPDLAVLARCSKALLAAATSDGIWRRRLAECVYAGVRHGVVLIGGRERLNPEPSWALAPIPISGEELVRRWEDSAEEYEEEIGSFSVKNLKAREFRHERRSHSGA